MGFLDVFKDDATTPKAGTKTTTPPKAGTQPVTNVMSAMVNNPSLPPGTEVVTNKLQENPDEILQYNPIDQNANQVETATGTTHTAAAPGQVDAATYQSTQAQAAQGEVDPRALVQNQIEQLMNGDQKWAQGAVRTANERSSARGLGASSINSGAITSAVIESALPIAAADAATFAQMGMQNLANRQQTMLSNQAADNASKQFNATSENQTAQFMETMKSQIEQFNASQANSMEQFNAGQTNAMGQFNSEMKNMREQFNSQMRMVIDQSNAQWRRDINTANTAASNAANQINAQNRLGISNTALNNIWQQFRDEADFAFTASQNDLNRAHNIAMAALEADINKQLMDKKGMQQLGASLGQFTMGILGNILGS